MKANQTKPKILVVEDETIVAADLQDRLKGMGYEVAGPVTNRDGAIREAERFAPDLALMDIMLDGEGDGIDAARELRSRFDVPVVFLSAYSGEDVRARARSAHPYGYLIKPFCDRELSVNLELALHRKHLDRERERLIEELRGDMKEEIALDDIVEICAGCKKVKEGDNRWTEFEIYFEMRTRSRFSHCLCPDCLRKHYPGTPPGRFSGAARREAG